MSPTREQATRAAGECIAEGLLLVDSLPSAEAARLCWTPTGPSLEQLEADIRAERAHRTHNPAA